MGMAFLFDTVCAQILVLRKGAPYIKMKLQLAKHTAFFEIFRQKKIQSYANTFYKKTHNLSHSNDVSIFDKIYNLFIVQFSIYLLYNLLFICLWQALH